MKHADTIRAAIAALLALGTLNATDVQAAETKQSAFSVAVCPVWTPALIVLLGVSAGIGSPWFGAVLLLAFAVGRAIPIMLGAVAVGWLENLHGLSRSQRAFDIVGGIVLMLLGLYMLNAYFFWVPELAI
jgi:cytochrome c-type biogenesis protein